MSCDVSQGNIRVQSAYPVWGARERTCVHPVADVASSLNNKFFLINGVDADGIQLPYYVWMNVNNTGVDPAETGKTGIEVDIPVGAIPSVIATAIASAINAMTPAKPFIAKAYGMEVVIENSLMGAVVASADGGVGDATAFEIDQIKKGSKLELGLTDDFDVSFSEELLDITASQTGPEVLARLRTGNTAGPITIPMKESDAAKLKEIFSVGGSVVTVDGTEVVGWGSSKQFTNVIPDSRMLVLEPVGAADRSEDLVFWLAYPNVNNINFSGTAERIVEVEFTIYKDKSRKVELDLFVLGDYTKNYLK